MRCWPSSQPRGFTLVEVLVALVVMATIALMAWQGVDGMVRTKTNTETRLNQTLQLGTVLAQWEVDLGAVQDTGTVPALSFDGSTLRLTRRTDTGIQLVAWSLRPEPESSSGAQQWQRWASPPVTRSNELQEHWLRSQQFQGNEPGQLTVLSGLSQWQLYFYRGNAWTNAQSSADLAPVEVSANPAVPRQRNLLPTGIRLVLTFAPGSGRSGAVTRDLMLGPQWP